jgi:hypothetical protein
MVCDQLSRDLLEASGTTNASLPVDLLLDAVNCDGYAAWFEIVNPI